MAENNYKPIQLAKVLDKKIWRQDKLFYVKNEDGRELHVRLVQRRDAEQWALFCPQTGSFETLIATPDWHYILYVVFAWYVKEPEKVADQIWKQIPATIRYHAFTEESNARKLA